MRRAMLLLFSTLACGCSYSMNEYQASGYEPATPTNTLTRPTSAAAPLSNAASAPLAPPRKATWIHATGEQGVVLGVTDNTDYVDAAYARLLAQCPGDVVGVNTRYSTKLGFLSYKNTIDIQALCLR
jgi:hypothetical protein